MNDLFDDYYAALRGAEAAAAAAAVVDGALMRGDSQVRLIREVIAHGQLKIGQGWEDGSLSQADEHAATAAAERALAILAQSLPPTAGGRRVVLACAEGEWHSMPGRLAGEQARAAGIDVTMLGGSLPAEHLHHYLLRNRPDALALSVTLSTNLVGASRSIDAAHRAGVPVIVGGAGWGADDRRARALGADQWLNDARAMPLAVEQVVERGELVDCPGLEPDVVLLASAPAIFAAQAAERQRAGSSHPSESTSGPDGPGRVDHRLLMRSCAAAMACADPSVLGDDLDRMITAMARQGLDPHRVLAGCEHLADVIASAVPRGATMIRVEARRRADQLRDVTSAHVGSRPDREISSTQSCAPAASIPVTHLDVRPGTESLLDAAIIDAIDSLVIVTEISTGTVVQLNRAAEKVIGLPREQVAGLSLWEICSPEHRATVESLFAGPHFDTTAPTHEATTISASGAHYRVVWSTAFLTDQEGLRTHIVSTGIDVTSGRATSGLFEQLMLAATTMVLIGTDQGGRITYCSAGAEQMFGTTSNGLVGRWVPCAAFGSGGPDVVLAGASRPEGFESLAVEVSHPDRRGDRQVSLGPLDRRSTGSGHHPGPPSADGRRCVDWVVTDDAGNRLMAEMTATLVTDALGDDAGYILVGADVTEQRRSRDLLVSRLAKEAQAADRLRELDRIAGDLVATVSHELRTPLTSILASVEMLKDDLAGPLTVQQRTLADAMDRNGARLLALVDDLLTMSTIDSGGLRCGPSALDLRDVVTSATRALAPLIRGRQLGIHVDLPATPTTVLGDARRLEQVVGNLLSNAVKFTEDGGTVRCSVTVDGPRARLTVQDDGIGIPEKELPGLFKKFFRSTTATDRAIQGTGLGLSIASSIVRGHHGTISITSVIGEGTEVVVELPLADPDADCGVGSPVGNVGTRRRTAAALP